MIIWKHQNSLILASKSQARQRLLAEQGLQFKVVPASLDEREIQNGLDALSIPEQAMTLARAKALTVSEHNRAHWVIGSDQLLVCNGQVLHQVSDKVGAMIQLKTLSGHQHELYSAACLVFNGSVVAECEDKAGLWMKPMSDHDISDYLQRVGATVFGSVGCYHIEGEGAALFDKIEGKRSTIMGMPVEDLVTAMLEQGLITQ